MSEVKDDFRRAMHNGVKEREKWCKAFEKNPKKALKNKVGDDATGIHDETASDAVESEALSRSRKAGRESSGEMSNSTS
ncbi:hypothetical protein DICSQDRAFT_170936 [Dichomitus squalens LYAD-421 SS1]|uniref:Uncharacterized protein n=1 Tax=Dichomitus squalens (strain LYAD-421) TaxID=732165 RepID=R7SWB8_DICSQ|nr:uncharacterized protein DICSQDRAFT_170936 [Dichomitus squalens LYAD-421 SS1]EJF60489.1 hypothetical protein DICSQDRAFT_170936 [Dichomitus squalens LYAD-421 SS1]